MIPMVKSRQLSGKPMQMLVGTLATIILMLVFMFNPLNHRDGGFFSDFPTGL